MLMPLLVQGPHSPSPVRIQLFSSVVKRQNHVGQLRTFQCPGHTPDLLNLNFREWGSGIISNFPSSLDDYNVQPRLRATLLDFQYIVMKMHTIFSSNYFILLSLWLYLLSYRECFCFISFFFKQALRGLAISQILSKKQLLIFYLYFSQALLLISFSYFLLVYYVIQLKCLMLYTSFILIFLK